MGQQMLLVPGGEGQASSHGLQLHPRHNAPAHHARFRHQLVQSKREIDGYNHTQTATPPSPRSQVAGVQTPRHTPPNPSAQPTASHSCTASPGAPCDDGRPHDHDRDHREQGGPARRGAGSGGAGSGGEAPRARQDEVCAAERATPQLHQRCRPHRRPRARTHARTDNQPTNQAGAAAILLTIGFSTYRRPRARARRAAAR